MKFIKPYILIFLILLVNTAIGFSEKLDIDGDTVTDLITYGNVDNFDKIPYLLNLTKTDSQYLILGNSLNEFASSSDYYGSENSDIVFININNKNEAIWNIVSTDNINDIKINFGTKNDILISGCNFNGDSKKDLAFIRRKKLFTREVLNKKVISKKITLPPNKTIKEIRCFDSNQNTIDELIVLYKKRNKTIIKAYNELGKEILKIRARNISHLSSFDNKYIAFSKELKKRGVIKVVDSSKKEILKINTKKIENFYSGKRYNSKNNLENTFIFLNKNNIYQYDFPSKKLGILSVNDTSTNLVLPNDSYIDSTKKDSNDNKLCQETHSAHDGKNGFLWKESEFGGLVVLLPSSITKYKFNAVDVYKDNNKIESLKFSSIANGYRQHWRSHKNSWNFPDYSTVIAKLSNYNICWKIGKSSQRND